MGSIQASICMSRLRKLHDPALIFCKECGHPSTDHTLTRISEARELGVMVCEDDPPLPEDKERTQWTLLDCRSWEHDKCLCPAFMVHRRFHKRYPSEGDNA